jgi:hypothetical protein
MKKMDTPFRSAEHFISSQINEILEKHKESRKTKKGKQSNMRQDIMRSQKEFSLFP